jgi:hypothetical protein
MLENMLHIADLWAFKNQHRFRNQGLSLRFAQTQKGQRAFSALSRASD